jgi:glucose/arabinose dehydrogenase
MWYLTAMLLRRALGLSLLVAGVSSACNKEPPPAAEEPRSASNAAKPVASPKTEAATTPGEAPAAAAAAGGASKFSDPSFELTLEPRAALKAGQPGNVEVVLIAKEPFHVNDKYPIKLKLKETQGLKYENMVLGKDQVKLETQRAVLPVSFTPERAGKHTVTGQFAFSVCTDEKCLMEKRDLALDVNVD